MLASQKTDAEQGQNLVPRVKLRFTSGSFQAKIILVSISSALQCLAAYGKSNCSSRFGAALPIFRIAKDLEKECVALIQLCVDALH